MLDFYHDYTAGVLQIKSGPMEINIDFLNSPLEIDEDQKYHAHEGEYAVRYTLRHPDSSALMLKTSIVYREDSDHIRGGIVFLCGPTQSLASFWLDPDEAVDLRLILLRQMPDGPLPF